MPLEIERKFLVDKNKFDKLLKTTGTHIKQGYLVATPEKTVRVRTFGDNGFITVKGKTEGASRPEFEYAIPLKDAEEMLEMFAESVIVKTRYSFLIEGNMWDVDIFEEDNTGLILAEVELEREDIVIQLPDWIGEEVTGDIRYYNSYLSKTPFSKW